MERHVEAMTGKELAEEFKIMVHNFVHISEDKTDQGNRVWSFAIRYLKLEVWEKGKRLEL